MNNIKRCYCIVHGQKLIKEKILDEDNQPIA